MTTSLYKAMVANSCITYYSFSIMYYLRYKPETPHGRNLMEHLRMMYDIFWVQGLVKSEALVI